MGESGAPGGGPFGEAFGDLSSLWGRRLNEYVEVWDRGVSKLLSSSYHAEDLLDDWFSLWGKAVRDSTTAMAATWQAFGGRSAAPHGDDRTDVE
jgi:hypothetical protein